MGKVFGILVIVVGIWVGLTIFTEGTDAAFGGLFAGSEQERMEGGGEPITRHVETKVNDAYRDNEDRIERQTAE